MLLAAQVKAGSSGGLRDKPGKRPDLYHTCNNLSGLSVAQHHMVHQPLLVEVNRRKFDTSKGLPAVTPTRPEGGWNSEEERQRVRKEVWANALGWSQLGEDVILGRKEDNIVVSPNSDAKLGRANGRTQRRPCSTSCRIVWQASSITSTGNELVAAPRGDTRIDASPVANVCIVSMRDSMLDLAPRLEHPIFHALTDPLVHAFRQG